MYMFTFICHYSNRRFIHAWKYSISFITKHNCTCTMALSPICRTLKSFYKLKWRYCLECKFKLFVICLSHIKLAILNNFFLIMILYIYPSFIVHMNNFFLNVKCCPKVVTKLCDSLLCYYSFCVCVVMYSGDGENDIPLFMLYIHVYCLCMCLQ